MKNLAVAAMLIALYLLYKIARQDNKGTSERQPDSPKDEPPTAENIVGQSRYVASNQRQTAQNTVSQQIIYKAERKDSTFSPQSSPPKSPQSPLSPPKGEFGGEDEEAEESEGDDWEEDFSMSPEELEADELDEEDEYPEAVFGEDERAFAGGLTYEEMDEALRSQNSPEVLRQMAGTDMFEQLALLDKGRVERIREILDRYTAPPPPEGGSYDGGESPLNPPKGELEQE